MGKKKTQENHIQESHKRSALSQQAARKRQDSIIKTNTKHKLQKGSTKEALPWNGQ